MCCDDSECSLFLFFVHSPLACALSRLRAESHSRPTVLAHLVGLPQIRQISRESAVRHAKMKLFGGRSDARALEPLPSVLFSSPFPFEPLPPRSFSRVLSSSCAVAKGRLRSLRDRKAPRRVDRARGPVPRPVPRCWRQEGCDLAPALVALIDRFENLEGRSKVKIVWESQHDDWCKSLVSKEFWNGCKAMRDEYGTVRITARTQTTPPSKGVRMTRHECGRVGTQQQLTRHRNASLPGNRSSMFLTS